MRKFRLRFGRKVDTSPPCRAQGSTVLPLDAGLPRSLDVDICGGIGMDGLHPMFAEGNRPKSQELLRRAIMQLCRACLLHFTV